MQSTSELHVAKPVIRMLFLLCGDASKIFKLLKKSGPVFPELGI